MKPRVVVIDDSPFVRRLIVDWLNQSGEFEVVGSANNGREGLAMVKEQRPDLVTLDIEMPIMDGLTCLRHIMTECPTRVIMVSSLTEAGATPTLEALELGAFDYFAKPNGSSSIKFIGCQEELIAKLQAAVSSATMRRLTPAAAPAKTVAQAPAPKIAMPKTDRVVLLASSTGGPKALAAFWRDLPKGFSAPILMVQHMPESFMASFAARLNSIGTVPCQVAKAGDRPVPGVALMAPGGKHMMIDSHGAIVLDDGPNLHGVKPAADHLFLTAAAKWGDRCLGAIFTGMGRDGAEGAKVIRSKGGYMIGESEETCVVYGMPRAAKEAGGIDRELPLSAMAPALVTAIVKGKNIAA